MVDSKNRYITAQEAESLLPGKDNIHTFYDCPWGLLGADWSRENVLREFIEAERIEIAGTMVRGMDHGIAVVPRNAKYHSDILFVETDRSKLYAFDSIENGMEVDG